MARKLMFCYFNLITFGFLQLPSTIHTKTIKWLDEETAIYTSNYFPNLAKAHAKYVKESGECTSIKEIFILNRHRSQILS